MINKNKNLVFLIDVDGTLSTGEYICDDKGKKYKVFGPDDTDALRLLRKYIHIEFISGDKKGFKISKNRVVDHMGFNLTFVDSYNRIEWIMKNFKKKKLYIWVTVFLITEYSKKFTTVFAQRIQTKTLYELLTMYHIAMVARGQLLMDVDTF